MLYNFASFNEYNLTLEWNCNRPNNTLNLRAPCKCDTTWLSTNQAKASIALAISQTTAKTVITYSQRACQNYLHGRISKSALNILLQRPLHRQANSILQGNNTARKLARQAPRRDGGCEPNAHLSRDQSALQESSAVFTPPPNPRILNESPGEIA